MAKVRIGGAGEKFALELGKNRIKDWWKRGRLADAYCNAAAETVEYCQIEGNPTGSVIRTAVADLLGSEARARQIANWYAHGVIEPTEFQDMIRTDEKVGRFLNYFIGHLNRQRAGLLPFDLQELAEIVITETGRKIEEATDKIIEAVREVPGTSRLHSISYWLGRPETIGDGFVGRDKDLDMIKEGFQNRRAIVISGGAGSGKSRLAAEYAHRSDAQGFWTAAGSDVVPTITALAPALDIEIGSRTDDEVAADVCRVLSNMPSDTLWVIDHLEQLEMVNLLLNAASISLLITTRDDRNQVLSTNIGVFQKLRELDSASAIRLLIMASESDPNDLALLEIADVVGYLPLALEMLAIRLGESNQSPNDVLEELHKVQTPIELDNFRKAGGTISDRLAGVYNTITGTLEKLPNDVRAAISPLGYVSDARIPNAFLSAITGISPQGLDSVIEECRLRSIVSVVDGDAIVHALTIAAIAATNSAGNLETTLGRAGGRLENIASNQLFLRAELTHHERILSESRKILESEHILVTAFASNLAIGYMYLGRYEDAVRLNEETLPIMERVLGPEHPDTLISRSNLAIVYMYLGRYEDAVGLDEETLPIRERVLGPEHPDTLGSRINLAILYRAVGRITEADELDRPVE